MQLSRIREYDETDKFAIKPSPLGQRALNRQCLNVPLLDAAYLLRLIVQSQIFHHAIESKFSRRQIGIKFGILNFDHCV